MENIRCNSGDSAAVCRSLLWIAQCQFTGAELGRFIKNLSVRGSIAADVLVMPDEILLHAVHALTVERRRAIEHFLFEALMHPPESHLLSRADVETLIQRQLPPDFPLVLRYRGQPDILRRQKVAIVGSRHPTFYGRQQSALFAGALAAEGICVLSGAAIGIDTVANLSAHAAGTTAAVLGSGLLRPYPRSNISLLKTLATSGRGLILSEFDDHQRAEKWNFPRRNRIIAALADFLLVVEAGVNSGTLITAHLAADYGTDVGALPGPVHSPTSQGSNQLIKEGAFCIEHPEEILERFINLSHQKGRRQEIRENESEFYRPTLSSLF